MALFWPRTIVVAAGLLLAPLADQLVACSCMSSGPPCQAAWIADVVFAGKVRTIEPVESTPTQLSSYGLRVTFDVERGFINGPPAVVEVATGTGGGDCGYGFVVGKRYLVYAWRRPPGLVTGICSRTRPIEEAREDIEYLSSMADKGSGGRVYGRVNERRRNPAHDRSLDAGPVAGITVSVQGTATMKNVVTDADGRFEVANLPVEKATVTVHAPFGFDARYLTRQIEIRDLRACFAQDFTLAQRATASGSVIDASGRTVYGAEVEAVAAELAGLDPPPHLVPVRDGPAWHFRVRQSAAGDVRLWDQSHQATLGVAFRPERVPARRNRGPRRNSHHTEGRRRRRRRRSARAGPVTDARGRR